MSYRIREVDGTDEEIADILKCLHDETFGSDAPQIDPERGHWWLAYEEGDEPRLAGFCGLTPTWSNPHTVGYLKRAGVLLPHRGQGLQARFIRVREARAKRIGYQTLVTDTSDNPSSANNLIRCGYRIYTPQHPWGFRHTIYWYKDLKCTPH